MQNSHDGLSQEPIKVLYLSYDGMTDPLGQSQVLPYLTGLSTKGYQIHLVSFEKAERFEATRKTIENICEQSGIIWHPLMYTKSPPILSTMKDLWAMKRISKELHHLHRFQIVHCRSYIAGMVGLWMKKKFGTKFLFDMRGFWADERVDGGLWNLKNPMFSSVYKFFKKQERAMLLGADHTISLTHAAKAEMEAWPSLNRQHAPITVIPCCVDLQHFQQSNVEEKEKEKWRDALGIMSGDELMIYLGSIGTWYMLDEMLAFLKLWLAEFDHRKVLFITKDDAAAIRENATKYGIGEKIIIQPADRKDIPALLSLGAIGIFFLKKAYSKMASSPVKQGEMMAMGLPVICNAGTGDTDEIVNTYKSGILVTDFTDEAYSAALANLKEQNFSYDAIRGGAEAYFSLSKGIESYEEVYKSLLL